MAVPLLVSTLGAHLHFFTKLPTLTLHIFSSNSNGVGEYTEMYRWFQVQPMYAMNVNAWNTNVHGTSSNWIPDGSSRISYVTNRIWSESRFRN